MTADTASPYLALPLPQSLAVALQAVNATCLDDVFLVSARSAGGADAILHLDAGARDTLILAGGLTLADYLDAPYDPPDGSQISPPHWTYVAASPVAGYDVRPLTWALRRPIATPFAGVADGATLPDVNAARYFTYGHDSAHTAGGAAYYSDDAGASWAACGGLAGCLHLSAFDPYGYGLAVGDDGARLYESRDYGVTWTAVPYSEPYDGSLWRYVDQPDYHTLMAADTQGDPAWFQSTGGHLLREGHRISANYTYSGVTTSGEMATNNGFHNFWASDVIDPPLSDDDVHGTSGRLWSFAAIVFRNLEHPTDANAGTLLPADNHLPYVKTTQFREWWGPVGTGAQTMLAWLGRGATRYSATVNNAQDWPTAATLRPDLTPWHLDDAYPPGLTWRTDAIDPAPASYPGDAATWANWGSYDTGLLAPSAIPILNGNAGGGVAFSATYRYLYWNVLNNEDAWTGYEDTGVRPSGFDDVAVRDAGMSGACLLVGLAGDGWRLARTVGGGHHAAQWDNPDYADAYSYAIGYNPPEAFGDFVPGTINISRNKGFGTVWFEDVGVTMAADLGTTYTASPQGIAAAIAL